MNPIFQLGCDHQQCFLTKLFVFHQKKAGGYFGYSVSMDPSGQFAIAGAPTESSYKGSATIFQRSVNNSWTSIPPFKITASDGDSNDFFGISTAIERSNHLFLFS
jgi:hypothetical protein